MDGNNNTSSITLEYSPNFQRHIVRNANNPQQERQVVIKSFLWLDDALNEFPGAA